MSIDASPTQEVRTAREALSQPTPIGLSKRDAFGTIGAPSIPKKPSFNSSAGESGGSPIPRLFALLIGINEYKYPVKDIVDPLEGCIADCNDVGLYLLDRRVPATRIQCLYNQQATRKNIKDALLGLADNPDIDKGDPILVFYAGHGSQALAPNSWSKESHLMEMILPHDFNYNDSEEEYAQGIPDVTLRILLSKIAAAKGNNITVIFDCCHSGSGTRGPPGRRARGVELPKGYRCLDAIDADLHTEASRGVLNANRETSTGSHVLLAACRPGELANETTLLQQTRGNFTTRLLEFLRSPGSDALSYKQIIQRLPELEGQHPQCEGINSSFVLFRGRPSNRKPVRLHRINMKGDQHILAAGEADGIIRGALFKLYKDEAVGSKHFGTARATHTDIFESIVELSYTSEPEDPPQTSDLWAVQIHTGKPGDVRIFIPATDAFRELSNYLDSQMNNLPDGKRGIRLVEDNTDADLSLQLAASNISAGASGLTVVFGIGDKYCKGVGLTQLQHTLPLRPQDFSVVLSAAAEFYWNLNRESSNDELTSGVTLECFRLEEREIPEREDSDFFPVGEDLVKDGILTISDFDHESQSPHYGLTLINHHDYPIYIALFYFDMSDMSIASLYLPPSAKGGNVEPSILGESVLNIGHQASAYEALQFELPELANGQHAEVDVGYLKVFLSTQYVDWENVEQESPFKGSRSGSVHERIESPLGSWDTMMVTVLLKKD